MKRMKAIAVSIFFLFSAVHCWAQPNSKQAPVLLCEVQPEKNFSGRIFFADSQRRQKSALPDPMPKPTEENKGALPNPMPEPIGEKKGALPDPMPKPVDTKILPGDPKPAPIREKKGALPDPMPKPFKYKSLPGDPKP
jgi:hypothetical protein